MQQMTSCAWVVSRWVVKKVVYNDDNCSLFNFETNFWSVFLTMLFPPCQNLVVPVSCKIYFYCVKYFFQLSISS